MEQLANLLKELNLNPDDLKTLAEKMKEDPMSAMGELSSMIPPEAMQKLLMTVMSNPEILSAAAEQAGVSEDQVNAAKDMLNL